MMAYADSSLLLKLYLREPETPAALAAVRALAQPIAFTYLHRLEIGNAIRRNAACKKVRMSQAVKAMRTLRLDVRGGFYSLPVLDWHAVFLRANRLSQRHARKRLVRSLDLLHVAAALEIGASEFLTFDDRQRDTAQAEGLKVLP